MIDRPSYLKMLASYKDKDLIKVITGVRRCGKSVLLFKLYHDWLIKSGISELNIIMVNLEDKENIALRNSDDLYSYIKTRASDDEKYYVFIDEIQYVSGFEDLLNSLKNRGMDVYITGSNSRMLSGDISTALRGRSIEIKVHPLSFSEYYSHVGGDKLTAFRDYMLYGGFPYVATETDRNLKIQYLQMLQDTVATKVVIERYGIRNSGAFNATYDFLCSNIGSSVSAKKIADTLKTNGYSSITPDTIGNYLQWISESFLFHKVYRYDVRGKEYLKTMNKYYATDLGLRNSRLNYRQIKPTQALENLVYNELIRRNFTVNIGKNKEREIDFIASSPDDTFYIQVAYSISDPEKRNQETKAFESLDDGYRKFIITMDNDPFILMENGYRILNVIDFLLNSNSLV